MQRRQPHSAPDAERKRAQQRERKRRYLRLHKSGGAILYVKIADYYALVAMLITTGWLREDEALDRREVENAVAAMLADAARAGHR